MISEFKSDDLVLVFLSSEKRFMRIEGTGDLKCKSDFERYIDTERDHTDIWELLKNNKRDRQYLITQIN